MLRYFSTLKTEIGNYLEGKEVVSYLKEKCKKIFFEMLKREIGDNLEGKLETFNFEKKLHL